MIKFKEKSFSNYIASGAGKGAVLGAGVGSFLLGANPYAIPNELPIGKGPKFIQKAAKGYNSFKPKEINVLAYDKKDNLVGKSFTPSESSGFQKLLAVGTTTLIGAALGAIIGAVREIDKKISHHNANNDRLMHDILKELKSLGYREGTQFTRDRNQANLLKTKVCVVITRDAAQFNMLVNTNSINDRKLESLTNKILRGLPSSVQVRKNNLASNKYNEINLSTISKTSSNINEAVALISQFIDGGYPVYIVEVG